MEPQPPSDMPDNSLLTYNPARLHAAGEHDERNFMTTVRSLGAWTVMESVDGVELPAPNDTTNTFTLEVKIGEGGFGEVWQACQHTLGRQVPVVATIRSKGFLVVRIFLDDDEVARSLPLGAAGAAAIYTQSGKPFHVISKITIRVQAWMKYLPI